MATVTPGVATADTSNVAGYTSASFTPAAGDLLVAVVEVTANNTDGTLTSSVGGQSFTRVTSATWNASTSRVLLFVANALSTAVAQTVTYTTGSGTATGCVVEVLRVSGMSLTGSAAVVQSAVVANGGGSPTVTFGAAVDTGNPTIVGVATTATTPGTTITSWTRHANTGYGTPTAGASAFGRDSGFTGTSVAAAGASAQSGVVAVELSAAASLTAVGADVAVPWTVRQAIAAVDALSWTVRQAVAASSALPWTVRQAVAKTGELPWTVRSAIAKDLAAPYGVRSLAGADSELSWTVRTAVAGDLEIPWGTAGAVRADARLDWTVHQAVADDLDLAWALLDVVAADTDLAWTVLGLAGADAGLEWVLRGLVDGDLELAWAVFPAPTGSPVRFLIVARPRVAFGVAAHHRVAFEIEGRIVTTMRLSAT